MLLANRRKKPGADGRTDNPVGAGTISFGSPLPNVQINDPQIPVAEAIAQIPGAIGAGMEGYAQAKANAAQASAPRDAGMGSSASPLLGSDWLRKLAMMRQNNPALGGQ